MSDTYLLQIYVASDGHYEAQLDEFTVTKKQLQSLADLDKRSWWSRQQTHNEVTTEVAIWKTKVNHGRSTRYVISYEVVSAVVGRTLFSGVFKVRSDGLPRAIEAFLQNDQAPLRHSFLRLGKRNPDPVTVKSNWSSMVMRPVAASLTEEDLSDAQIDIEEDPSDVRIVIEEDPVDVKIVMEQANVSGEVAKQALREVDGQVVLAIINLTKSK